MAKQSIFDMKLFRIYPLLVQKAERKGRSKTEVDALIAWLTGWDMAKADMEMTYGDFFRQAPMMNPRAELIHGSVCGVKIEAIEDPLMKSIRQLDKLVDELAKGKTLEQILR